MADSGLDLAAVRSAFNRAATTYDAHAVLQREVGARLASRLDYMTLAPRRLLDLGCGTGLGTHQLLSRYPAADGVALDLAPAMLASTRARFPAPGLLGRLRARLATAPPSAAPHLVCADMARLPFAPNTFDLVWSNLTLQWALDPEACFRGLYRVLRPGGLLMFSTLGPDTLKELRAAFATVDDAPHVNRFIDLHDVGDLLVHAGFAHPVMEMEMLTLTYADLRTLMQDLKGIGARNAALARPRGLMARGRWQQLEAAYERFRRDGRLPASFEVVYGHAWVGETKHREDGRQVIALQIAQRRAGLR